VVEARVQLEVGESVWEVVEGVVEGGAEGERKEGWGEVGV
jgi:hypothetical protein